MAEQYDIVSQNTQSTVVSLYERPSEVRETSYQGEKELERDFIEQLTRQGYERLYIHQEDELIDNLRRQLERLNDYVFTDGEWQRFFKTEIANEGKGIEDKAFTIQQDCVKTLTLDDGTIRNIKLIDKKDVHANITQVINQYEVSDGSHKNRYDVTILVNGLPLVHIELKRRGVLLKEAFNQINRYGRESFWAGNALFEYVQIFVISNGNTSTKELEKQINNPKSKIIITTIQKLSTYVKKNPQSDFYKKEVVMIFDECHRSQFGDMHKLIVKRFKRYYLFGFTGTPIFAENVSPGRGIYKTTEDVFGYRLHTYTIVDAIRDHNVLPFRVDYVKTMKEKEEVENSKVWDIEREKALQDPRRIHNVAQYILDHYDQQTKRGKAYSFSLLANVTEVAADKKKKVDEQRVKARISGFNSIFAVQNIHCAKLYYLELKQMMDELPENKRMKIATIFSYAPNEQDVEDGDGEENSDNTDGLDSNSREFLERAIDDYNKMFGTSYDTSADKFPNYYKDVSLRMKNREIDILIVVNMFLTGFDATTLNTLWVDKNLRYHGLLQSYSRTNRILNSIKTFGNIVCFRNLEEPTNKCIALFGDPSAKGITILRPFEDYFNGYTDEDGKKVKGYKSYLEELLASWAPGELPLGEKAEKSFIRLFGTILKMRNLLSCFDQFNGADFISERDIQDYTSIYLDLADKYRREKHDKEDICDDIIFEMELVKQVEVNIDYILFLVQQYHEGHQQDMEIRVKINKAIDSSPDLRDKKELIDKFIDDLTPDSDVDADWKRYVNREKREQFDQIITEEHLKREKAVEFIENAFQRGYVPEGGMELDSIMPPINPFDKSANRQGKIQTVLEKLKAFFNKFFDIADGEFKD